MFAKEEQLIQLLGLMARSMTHMTASVTAMAFEQLRSQDAALQSSAKRMIERMQAINELTRRVGQSIVLTVALGADLEQALHQLLRDGIAVSSIPLTRVPLSKLTPS